MSEARQETVINADYVAPEHRQTAVGNIPDTRNINQKVGDSNWKPVMPTEVEHRHVPKIAELEQEVAARKRDQEFSKLKTVEERALFSLREQREADFEQQERKAAEKQWLQDQSKPLARLAELRQAMAEADPGTFTIKDIVKIDQARKQFSTFGSDLKAGEKMLDSVEQRFAEVMEAEQLKIKAQLMGLENKKNALLAKLRSAVAEPPESEFDRLISEHREYDGKIQAAKDAGDYDTAHALIKESATRMAARRAAREAAANE